MQQQSSAADEPLHSGGLAPLQMQMEPGPLEPHDDPYDAAALLADVQVPAPVGAELLLASGGESRGLAMLLAGPNLPA